jgi:parallel beta-helix repeat protein
VAIKFPSHGVDNPDYELDRGRYANVSSRVPEIDRGTSEPRGCKEQRLPIVVIGMFIVAVLFTASLSLLPDPSSDVPLVPVPVGIYYTSHTNISIDGNAQFNNTNFPNNGVVSGNGSASNPFIIEGWDISAVAATGIYIRNTNAHFVVRDCYVHDGRYGSPFSFIGISLLACANGTISNNICLSDAYGIYLRSSVNSIISDNNCSNGILGIYLATSSNDYTMINNTCLSNSNDGIEISESSGNLINNICSNNGRGIYIRMSSSNNVINNTCSSNTYDGVVVGSSGGNTLINNNCSNNNQRGMWIVDSSGETVALNRICNNTLQGVYLQSGSNNRFWNNTFNGNNGGGIQAQDDGTSNWWNTSGSPHGYGNWWSDLTSPDANSDGIVDWSYNLTGTSGAKDYYPLTTPLVLIPEFGGMQFMVMVLLVATMLIGEARRRKAS